MDLKTYLSTLNDKDRNSLIKEFPYLSVSAPEADEEGSDKKKRGRKKIYLESFPGLYRFKDPDNPVEKQFSQFQNLVEPEETLQRAWIYWNKIANSRVLYPNYYRSSLIESNFGWAGIGSLGQSINTWLVDEASLLNYIKNPIKEGFTNYFVSESKKEVTTKLNLATIYIPIHLQNISNVGSPEYKQVLDVCRYFIPNFEFPTQWVRQINENGRPSAVKNLKFSFKGQSSGIFTLNQAHIRTNNFLPPHDSEPNPELLLSRSFFLGEDVRKIKSDSLTKRDKEELEAIKKRSGKANREGFTSVVSSWKDRIQCSFSIDGDKSYYIRSNTPRLGFDGVDNDNQLSGGIMESGWFIIAIRPEVRFVFPASYAAWVTSAKDIDDVTPYNFVNLLNARLNSPQLVPQRIGSLRSVRKDRLNRRDVLKISEKPRTNEDGFSISGQDIVYLPTAGDQIELYEKELSKTYNPETGEIISPKNIASLRDLIVYVDWTRGVILYTDSYGMLSSFYINGDLTGRKQTSPAFPLDNSTIVVYLEDTILNTSAENGGGKSTENFLEYVKKMAQAQIGYSQNFLSRVPEFSSLKNSRLFLPNLINHIIKRFTKINDENNPNKTTKIKLYQLLGGAHPTDISNENGEIDNEFVESVKELRRILIESWKDLESKKLISVMDLFYYKFHDTVVKRYAPDYLKTNGLNVQYKKNHADLFQPEDVSNIDIPNMAGVPSLFPHQASVIAGLIQKNKTNNIVDVEMGGGKTITLIAYILSMLDKGAVKRPLIIVPSVLVREFVKSINWVTAGVIEYDENGNPIKVPLTSVNAVPITSETLKNVQANLKNIDKKGDEDLRQRIGNYWLNSPPNTIFITTYEFLRSRGDLINYGNTEILEMPNLDFMLKFGFDLVAMDESHRAKNDDSVTTKVARILMAGAKYRVLSSGTIVNNNAGDIVGQVSQLNQYIFGNINSFIERFSDTLNKVNLSLDSIHQIQKDMIKFQMNYIVKKRSEWSYLLPRLIENYHLVSFTPTQEYFYNALVNLVSLNAEINIENIEENEEKVKSKKKDSGPQSEEEEEINESTMRTSLSRAEIFICAPDKDMPLEKHSAAIRKFNLLKNNSDIVEEQKSDKAYLPAEISFKEWKGSPENKIPPPTEEDLIGPKIPKINQLVRAHFGKTKMEGVPADPDNKLIIFSYHKKVSLHIYANLDQEFKNKAVHYSVDNKEVLDKFIDPNSGIDIIVADETSLGTGFNLQMASRIIRVQTVWNPGDLEQSLARIHRPIDPRKMVNKDGTMAKIRSQVYQDWVLAIKSGGGATLDTAKMGRTMYKTIEKARFDNERNPNWDNSDYELIFPIPMILETIQTLSWSNIEKSYLGGYKKFRAWQDQEDLKKLNEFKIKFREKFGRDPIHHGELVNKINVEFKNDRKIGGGKRIYAPWVPGGTIVNELGLTSWEPVAILVNPEDENDNADIEDNNVVILQKGLPVMTEFGPGFIESIMAKKCRVRVNVGRNRSILVLLNKTVIYTTINKSETLKLENFAKTSRYARIPDDAMNISEPENEAKPALIQPKSPPGQRIVPKPVIAPTKPNKTPIKLVDPLKPDPSSPAIRPKINTPNPTSVPPKSVNPTIRPAKTIESSPAVGSLMTGAINNIAAVMFIPNTEKDWTKAKTARYDFNYSVGDFLYVHISKLSQMSKLLELLNTQFIMDPSRKAQLEAIAASYADINKEEAPIVRVAPSTSITFKNFFEASRRPLPVNSIKPYIVFWDGQMQLIFDKNLHKASRTWDKLVKIFKRPGPVFKGRPLWTLDNVDTEGQGFLLHPAANIRQAEAFIRSIIADRNFDLMGTASEALEELKRLNFIATSPKIKPVKK